MDVRIGVSQTAKEIEIELAEDADLEAVKAEFVAALAEGSTFWLTDRRGRQVGVPAEKLAYLEFGAPQSGRRIGFS